MTTSISLGSLGMTLVFLAPLLVLRLRNFIFHCCGQLRYCGLNSPRYSLLNGVPLRRHSMEVFFTVKQPFHRWILLPNNVVHVVQQLVGTLQPKVWSQQRKPSKTLGCETRGGIEGPIEGTWTNLTIWGVWTRSRHNQTSGFARLVQEMNVVDWSVLELLLASRRSK